MLTFLLECLKGIRTSVYLLPNSWCPVSKLTFFFFLIQYVFWQITLLSIQKCSIILNIFSAVSPNTKSCGFSFISLSSLITSLLLQCSRHLPLEPWWWTANLSAYVHCHLFSSSFSAGQPQLSLHTRAWPMSLLCFKSFSGCLLPWAKSLTRP